MQWFRAQDTFTADLADHTQVRVVKGEPLPETHELVKRDADAAAAAAKAGIDRVPLFQPMDSGEDEGAPKSAPAKAEPKATPPVKAAAKPAAKQSRS
jgi:hypothetical protein